MVGEKRIFYEMGKYLEIQISMSINKVILDQSFIYVLSLAFTPQSGTE